MKQIRLKLGIRQNLTGNDAGKQRSRGTDNVRTPVMSKMGLRNNALTNGIDISELSVNLGDGKLHKNLLNLPFYPVPSMLKS